MSTAPAALRMVEEYGRPAVRAPVPAAAVPATATYDVDEIRADSGTGWMVTVSGSAEVITDPDEAALPSCLQGMRGAPIHRTLAGLSHGPQDALLRPQPKTVTGFRLARGES